MLLLAVITTCKCSNGRVQCVRNFGCCLHLKIDHSFLAVVHLQNLVCDPVIPTVTSSPALLGQLKFFSEASCSCVFCSTVLGSGLPGSFSVGVQ